MSQFTDTLINIMKCFLLPTDVAKQLKDAENAATEAAADQIKAEREALKQRRVDLVLKWGLPNEPPLRIGRPSFQQIWDTGLWRMLDKVVNGQMNEPPEVHLRPPATFVFPSATPAAVIQHHVALNIAAPDPAVDPDPAPVAPVVVPDPGPAPAAHPAPGPEGDGNNQQQEPPVKRKRTNTTYSPAVRAIYYAVEGTLKKMSRRQVVAHVKELMPDIFGGNFSHVTV